MHKLLYVFPLLMFSGCMSSSDNSYREPLTPQEAAYKRQKDICEAALYSSMLQPTSTGSFGSSLGAGGQSYSDCMAGVRNSPPQATTQPTPAQQPIQRVFVIDGKTYVCTKMPNGVVCN